MCESSPSGIQAVGDLAFGTHFCQLYRTRQDLLDTLVPFFIAGLRHGEACIWVTSEPLSAEEAREAMRDALPGFDDYAARGQIEICDYRDWYMTSNGTPAEVLEAWLGREKRALAQGFTGLRLTGNTSWLERSGWDDFMAYERAVNETFGRFRIIALCTYSLDRCCAEDVLDVCRNHQFTLSRRTGGWDLLESSSLEVARQEPDPATAGRRILVVDDNQDAAESLQMLLELAGHEVHLACDGEEALSLFESTRPEVVLLDIGLPRLDGLEVARRLRAGGRNRDVLLVALTGYGQEADRTLSRDAGFDHHLVKPVEPATLLGLLTRPS